MWYKNIMEHFVGTGFFSRDVELLRHKVAFSVEVPPRLETSIKVKVLDWNPAPLGHKMIMKFLELRSILV